MGVLVGLGVGAGLFCVWWACWDAGETGGRPASVERRPGRLRVRIDDVLQLAGATSFGVAGLGLVSLLVAFAAFVVVAALTKALVVAACFALIGGYLPIAVVLGRARQRRDQQRGLWPDVVDNLASAVRAGLSLPEALGQLGGRGPEPLRPAFAEFAHDYQASARFAESLDALKERLADPVGDRICEALRITREVGGSDLGTLLRNLSTFLREDARTRSELEARQSWTVSAARLAVAAPWVVLLLLAGRPETLAAYSRPGGGVVLLTGAVSSLGAYWLMLRIARLPAETRVLR